VNGSVLAFAGCVLVAGALLEAGSTVLAGVVGVFVDVDGDVPLVGVGAFCAYPLVLLAARAGAAGASPSARTTGRIMSLRRARDDPHLVVAVSTVCDLLEAMTLVRVMPTSRSWSDERCNPSSGHLP